MLGHIENNRARHRLMSIPRLTRMLRGVVPYIYEKRSEMPRYPTHRTEEQKRELRNKRARAATKARRAQRG